MPCRTTGYNINLFKALDLIFGNSHCFEVNPAIFDHRIQGILNCFRLLMDLFHHEMFKTGLFCRFCIPFDFRSLLLDFIPVQVIEMSFSRSQLCKLKVAYIIHISGIFQDSRDIGRHIGLPIRNTDDHRAVLTGYPDLTGIVTEHQLQRIGSANTHHGFRNGINGTEFILLVVIIHQLDRYLCIGLAVKCITMLQQFFFQFRVIFNDTIMYANDFRFYRAGTGSAAVAGDMGMGIDLTGFAMGCPTGMSNTTGSFQRISIVRFLDQIRKTALRLYYLCQGIAIADCKSCRVIPSIFQF